jgi:L-threonylcarbamoyladenylate synthase
MEILNADPESVDPSVVARVSRVLMGGGIVAMRTDTVYGLLASVDRPDALEKLVELKVRPRDKPFVLLAADWIAVRAVTSHLPPVARILGSRYWPGPLTLVLPGHEDLPPAVCASGPTVAVRIPGDPLLLAILHEFRGAVAAPSANLPGEPPATSVEEVAAVFDGSIDLAVDSGPAPASRPSTIVNCTEFGGEILREGPVQPSPRELTAG